MMVETGRKRKALSTPSIPDEIILEIFSHLPAESLLGLINDFDNLPNLKNPLQTPFFVKKHAFNMTNRPEMRELITDTPEAVQREDDGNILSQVNIRELLPASPCCKTIQNRLDTLFYDSTWKLHFRIIESAIIGSCFGLVCLAVINSLAKRFPQQQVLENLFLWNPATKEHFKVPFCPRLLWSFYKAKFGFGYDNTNSTFKLVVAYDSYTMFYDHSKNSWECIQTIDWIAIFNKPTIARHNNGNFSKPAMGHYLNGALHWIVSTFKIMSLDLATKECSYISLPDCCSDPEQYSVLGVFGDFLVISCNLNTSKEVGIWIMKEYGKLESWTKVYTVRKDVRHTGIRSILNPPLWISEDGEMLFKVEDRLVFWNPQLEEFRFTKKGDSFNPIQGQIHVSTLVSPIPKNNIARII